MKKSLTNIVILTIVGGGLVGVGIFVAFQKLRYQIVPTPIPSFSPFPITFSPSLSPLLETPAPTISPRRTDLSTIFIFITPALQFIVTDPNGRRTGFDPVSNQSIEEIPGARYSFQAPLRDPVSGETSGPGSREFALNTPPSGSYTIEVHATSSQDYRIAILTYDQGAEPSFGDEPTHHIAPESSNVYLLSYSPEPGATIEVKRIQ